METQPKKSWVPMAITGVVGFFVIVVLIGVSAQPAANNSMSDADMKTYLADARASATGNSTDPAAVSSAWEYSSHADAMNDRRTEMACVRSENEAQLDFPYHPVHAQLCLRNSPQYGRDAFVQLEGDGQILCYSYQGCSVGVRFDQAQARNFSATDSSDGSSNIVFIRDRRGLERGLRDADRTAIQVQFYQAGRQALIFPTSGLDWPAGR